MKLSIAIALSVAVYQVAADCANSCSGRGTCGAHDECSCFFGFAGADCSERLCPQSFSWVTTPQGDINYDGKVNAAATYESTTRFMKHNGYVYDQRNKGGTWELYPSFASAEEGHFIMECSNKGLCDRSLGECQCFSGFTGHACQRSTCMNGCSGHGMCLSIEDQLSMNNGVGAGGAATSYSFWDASMSYSCKCDPGFSGVDCSQRVCPLGDDPLTTKYQIDETQYVRVYVNNLDGTYQFPVDMDGSASNNPVLGGTFTLTYENLLGQKFETSDISVARWTSGTASTMATAVKDALEALPNSHIPSVSVQAVPCGEVQQASSITLTSVTTVAYQNGDYFRCPNAPSNSDEILYGDGTDLKVYGSTTAVTTLAATPWTAAEKAGCEKVKYPECVEFQITFSDASNSGDLKELTVDVSKTTYAGETNSQQTGTPILSSVSDSKVSTAGDLSARFVVAGLAANTATSALSANPTTASGKTTLALADPGAVYTFPAGAKVSIVCTASSIDYPIGTFEVDTSVASDGTNPYSLVLAETLYDPKGRCVSGNNVKVTLQTSFIEVDADMTEVIGVLSHGVYLDDSSTTNLIKSTVASLSSYDSTNNVHYLLLTETPSGSTANVDCASTCTVSIHGKGTKESDECSGRGLCDSETGKCNCFKGYQGASCQLQDALYA